MHFNGAETLLSASINTWTAFGDTNCCGLYIPELPEVFSFHCKVSCGPTKCSTRGWARVPAMLFTRCKSCSSGALPERIWANPLVFIVPQEFEMDRCKYCCMMEAAC